MSRISSPCRHGRNLLSPPLLKPSNGVGQLLSETHVGSSPVVERLEKARLLLKMGAFLAETQGLAHQRRQGLPKGQIESFQQPGADGQTQAGQAFCATYNACRHFHKTPLALPLNDPPIHQVWMRGFDRLSRTPQLPRAGKGLEHMITRYQRLKIRAEAITEKDGNAQDDLRCHINQLQCRLIGPWANNRSQNQAA